MQAIRKCLNDTSDESSPELFKIERMLKSFDLKFNSNNQNILAY